MRTNVAAAATRAAFVWRIDIYIEAAPRASRSERCASLAASARRRLFRPRFSGQTRARHRWHGD
jgi:hypothetical protein